MRWGLSALLCLFATVGNAHTLRHTTTELTWRPDAQAIEVVHQIHLDDAMYLLSGLGDPRGVLDVATQARLMLYVERNVDFWRGDGTTALVAEPVGAEFEGDYLWVYQTLSVNSPPRQLRVKLQLMHEYFSDQQHLVNWIRGSTTRSLHLSTADDEGTFAAFEAETDE